MLITPPRTPKAPTSTAAPSPSAALHHSDQSAFPSQDATMVGGGAPASGPLDAETTHHHHLPTRNPSVPPSPKAAAPAPPSPDQPPAVDRLQQHHPNAHLHVHHDPSHVWIPELIDRIAAHLPNPNQVPLCLRLVNTAAATHLRRRHDLRVRLSLPAPHAEFVWRFGGGGSRAADGGSGGGCAKVHSKEQVDNGCGGSAGGGGLPQPHTTSWQVRQLLPLTARSGAVENLPVAAAALRAAFTPPRPTPSSPSAPPAANATPGNSSGSGIATDSGSDVQAVVSSADVVTGGGGVLLSAAAGGGSAAASSAGEQVVAAVGSAAVAEAAGAGHLAAAVWLVRVGGFAATKTALERAARAGDEAMCRWLLGAEGCCPWTFAAPAAALRAGHAVLGEWLMRRRPCGAGAGTGTGSGVPSCASLTSLSLSSSTPSPYLPPPAAACSNSGGGGGRDCGNSCGGGGGGVDGGDDGPAPQRPGQVLGGRRTWLDGVMAAAARGCGLQQLVVLHERWLDSRGATIEGPGANLVLAAAAGSPTADWADKVVWVANAGYWSGTPAAAEAAAVPGGWERIEWLRGRGYAVGPDAVEAAARAGQLDVLDHLLRGEWRLRLGLPAVAAAAAAMNAAVGAGQLAALQLLVAACGCRPGEPQLLRAAAGTDVSVLTWLLDQVRYRLVSTAGSDTGTGVTTHAAPAPGAVPGAVPAAPPGAAAAAAGAGVAGGAGGAAAALEGPISADRLLRVAAGSEATAGSTAVLQALWDWSWSGVGGSGGTDGDSGDGDGGGGCGGGAGGSGDCGGGGAAGGNGGVGAVTSRLSASASGAGPMDGDRGHAAMRRAWRCQALFAAAVAAGSEEKAVWLAERGCGMPADGSPYVHAAATFDQLMLRRLQQLGCSPGLYSIALPGSSRSRAAATDGCSSSNSSPHARAALGV